MRTVLPLNALEGPYTCMLRNKYLYAQCAVSELFEWFVSLQAYCWGVLIEAIVESY